MLPSILETDRLMLQEMPRKKHGQVSLPYLSSSVLQMNKSLIEFLFNLLTSHKVRRNGNLAQLIWNVLVY